MLVANAIAMSKTSYLTYYLIIILLQLALDVVTIIIIISSYMS